MIEWKCTTATFPLDLSPLFHLISSMIREVRYNVCHTTPMSLDTILDLYFVAGPDV